MTDVQNIVRTLWSRYHGGRFLVGLDGFSRAGKTSLTAQLRDGLMAKHQPMYIFHIDDHIVPRSERYNTGFEPWYEFYQLQWDVEQLERDLFRPLREGKETISVFFYDPVADRSYEKSVNIAREGLVLIEGVFLQRPEWQSYLDFVVFLDCPREVRFERESAQAQQQLEKFESRYWMAENHYLEQVNPLLRADLVIRSN